MQSDKKDPHDTPEETGLKFFAWMMLCVVGTCYALLMFFIMWSLITGLDEQVLAPLSQWKC